MSLLQYAARLGFDLTDIPHDGTIHRFGRNKKNWAIVFPDTGVAEFGDWSAGSKHVFKPKGIFDAPPAEVVEKKRVAV